MKTVRKETAAQAVKRQVAELRPFLPVDWREKFFSMYPDYDTYRGGQIVDRVYCGNGSNPEVLEGLKKIVEQEKQKGSADLKTA